MKFFNAFILTVILFSCGKKAMTDNNAQVTPSISIANVAQQRDNSISTNFQFKVTLDRQFISVNNCCNILLPMGQQRQVLTILPARVSLTIPANENNVAFNIEVRGDSLREADKTFYVQLSDPVNASLSTAAKSTAIIQCTGTYLPVDDAGYITPLSYAWIFASRGMMNSLAPH